MEQVTGELNKLPSAILTTLIKAMEIFEVFTNDEILKEQTVAGGWVIYLCSRGFVLILSRRTMLVLAPTDATPAACLLTVEWPKRVGPELVRPGPTRARSDPSLRCGLNTPNHKWN